MAINKHYAQLEFKSGSFYEYSKEEKEGFEKHTSSKGNVSWRKYYEKGISGVLESLSVYDGTYGQSININIKDGEDVYIAQFSLYDQRGNVDTYAEELIKLIPSLEKGDNITVFPYNFTPDGEQYSKIGVSIKYQDGEKVKRALSNAYYKNGDLVQGDIPAIKWKKDPLGKNKPSAASLEEKTEYLVGVLAQQTERLKWDGENSNTEQPKPSKEVPTATPQEAFSSEGNSKSFIKENEDPDNPLPF